MGIAGRDYMRDDGRRRPLLGQGRVTWTIIGLNALLWFLFSSSMNAGQHGPWQPLVPDAGLAGFFWRQFVLHPEQVFVHGKLWQLFTSMWMHDPYGAQHVLFNMLALFFFGRVTESYLGRRGYLWLYLGGGLLCSLMYTGYAYLTGHFVPALGASGAVYAVLFWMAVMNPRATIYLMLVFPMPMWLAVGVFMVGIEVLTLAQNLAGAGAAVGHLSGAAWGFLYFRYARRWSSNRGPGGWLVSLRHRRKSSREAHREQAGRVMDVAEIRERVDRLLAKISNEGMGALTEEEKHFLTEAARRFS